jgi:hypothetical protein
MSDANYPSGPWVGFYTYHPGDKHRMDLHLSFTNGVLTGSGNDDIAPFVISGRYDAANGECYWTKIYPGSHDVFYRGFRDGKGIWGTWEIRLDSRGGFHIWPRARGEGDAASEPAGRAEPADVAVHEADVTSRRFK